MASNSLIPLLLIVIFTCTSNGQLNVWLSTGDSLKKLNPEAPISRSDSPGPGFGVTIDQNSQYQSIEGFGASMTDASAYNIYNSPQKSAILSSLFKTDGDGIGLSYIRLPMGGTDFSVDKPYSYNDINPSTTDFDLQYFSIEKDRRHIIPVLKQALQLNPDLKILGTPWTAPAWMKTTKNLYGGELINDNRYLNTYANYMVKFIQAYAAEGIQIHSITVQNEPMHEINTYPTMKMQSWMQRNFVKDFLGPAFQRENIVTNIIIWDHNWDNTGYPLDILNDQNAKKYVSGSAWHCYAGDYKSPQIVHNAHPDRDIYFTECSGGAWDEHFGSSLGWNAQRLFIGQMRVWARTVMLWNIALDENYGPKYPGLGGCSNCRGVVLTKADGTYDKNIEYYALGHFSKFLRRGAKRIESTTFESDGLESIAFQNPDGSLVIAVLNAAWGDNNKDFHIKIGNDYYNYSTLPSRSLVTFVRPASK